MTIIEAANKYFGYEVKDVQQLFEEMDEEFTYNRRWIEVMQFLKWVITIGISSCLLRTALPFWGLIPVGFVALWLGDEV